MTSRESPGRTASPVLSDRLGDLEARRVISLAALVASNLLPSIKTN